MKLKRTRLPPNKENCFYILLAQYTDILKNQMWIYNSKKDLQKDLKKYFCVDDCMKKDVVEDFLDNFLELGSGLKCVEVYMYNVYKMTEDQFIYVIKCERRCI